MTSNKRRMDVKSQSREKRVKPNAPNYFRTSLRMSGLIINDPPDECILDEDQIIFSKKLKQHLRENIFFPNNVDDFVSDFAKEISDPENLKHYLQCNLAKRTTNDELLPTYDCLIKLLLNQNDLQAKLFDVIIDKATDLVVDSNVSLIQIILKCFVGIDYFENQEKLASSLVNLLDISDDKTIKMEILSFIPDIIQTEVHDKIAIELSKFLIEDHEILPVLLNCITFLNFNDSIYFDLQKRALSVLRSSPRFTFFPNIVKFLLIPGRLDDIGYLEVIQNLRSVLNWKNIKHKQEDIPNNQVLTAMEIYNSINSSKVICECWYKSVANCKTRSDYYAIDIPIIIILYNCLDNKQRIITLLKKKINSEILTQDLICEAFDQFQPILKNYIYAMLELVSLLLKLQSESTVVQFASQWYMTMFSTLDDHRPVIIAEIIQRGLSNKKFFMDGVSILKEIAEQNLNLLQPQSLQLLALLDRLDELNLSETREIMSLLCGLAYKYEDSALKDDVHMFITKQLRSVDQIIKTKGVLSAVSAIKHLIINSNEELEVDSSESELSYMTYNHFSEGPNKQAAHFIESIVINASEASNILGYFYEELSDVISGTQNINKHFLTWLSEAATNDLQSSFIVDEIASSSLNDLQLTLQYGINADEELDGVIALNIGGLTLGSKKEEKYLVKILPALFRLVQNLKVKQNDGDLSTIDALLGCPIVLPTFNTDTCIDDFDPDQVSAILDCLIISINWFRELINAFASQKDEALRKKVLKRIYEINDMQQQVNKILSQYKGLYKPPICTFNISDIGNIKITKINKPNTKAKNKTTKDDQNNTIPPTAPTQQNANIFVKSIAAKYDAIKSIPFRKINFFTTACLLKETITMNTAEDELNLESLAFLTKSLNEALIDSLKPYSYKVSHLRKENVTYNQKRASSISAKMAEIIPHLLDHIEVTIRAITDEINQNEEEALSTKKIEYELILENLFKSFSIFFNWIGFRKTDKSLLKSSLRIIALKQECNIDRVMNLEDLLFLSMNYFKKFCDRIMQISTAVALVDLLMALYHLSENEKLLKVVQTVSRKILSKAWFQFDGVAEKGLFFNQQVDHIMTAFLMNPELKSLKQFCTQIQTEVTVLNTKTDVMDSLKSISKSNFPILFRHMVTAVGDAAKKEVEKPLTNHEHLELWNDVAIILKILTEIAKSLENRNNFSSYLKRCQPILKLFISHGMPIIEIKMKNEMELAVEVLKVLQSSTRFMQNLCCHSRLKKDTALLAKVPQIRLLLETIVYKVKAALAANKCSEAFWMGNLKNKNLQGEVIASQQSVEEAEDADDQLPPDESPDDSDAEDSNAELKSTSDIADTSC